jgi:5-formyltetrahydrofolate cyclo-ligase
VPNQTHERKAVLRSATLAARAALDPASRDAAGVALSRHGCAAWRDRRAIATYLSFGSEPPTNDLVDGLHSAGVEVLVPVVTGNGLDWVRYSPHVPTTAARLGVPEPVGPRLGAAAIHTVDLVIVPSLAVDRLGNRLGRGRGFYDRALEGVSAPVVAVLYDSELLDEVPAEPHDRRVQAVLRPAGLDWLSPS